MVECYKSVLQYELRRYWHHSYIQLIYLVLNLFVSLLSSGMSKRTEVDKDQTGNAEKKKRTHSGSEDNGYNSLDDSDDCVIITTKENSNKMFIPLKKR